MAIVPRVQHGLKSYEWLKKLDDSVKRESDLSITGLRKQLDIGYKFSSKYEPSNRRNAQQQRVLMTHTVHLHRHDVLTVLFNCPIKSMMHTLSYWCSNQSRSIILL